MSTTPAGGPSFFRVSRWYEKHPIAKLNWILRWVSEEKAHRQECLCYWKAKCGRRNFKFENFKFEMRCKGSREMRREWRTLRVVWDPALSQWANLCRAPTKKTGRRNRAYGAGFEGAKAKAHRQECLRH